MAERDKKGDDYVEPLEETPIDPLTVDPVAAVTGAVDVVEVPVNADGSPYQALLEADQHKSGRRTARRTSHVAAPPVATEEVDDEADIVADEVPMDVVFEADAENEPSDVAPRRVSDVTYQPESADLLTAERLLEPSKMAKIAPEGGWPRFVYGATFHTVNIGDSRKVRSRKALDARIATRLTGGARFVPILTRKGGVGKTTVTTLLGMALASVRDDRVVAIDANPDRGTLAERISRSTESTVRDLVANAANISGYTGFSEYTSRDETRLDVLASETDPHVSEAFSDADYETVAELAAQNYSIILTDCGTGIVHSVMKPVLERAHSIVVVTGSSVDEARLASETLTWLETNGHANLVSNAVVAINLATQGSHLVKLSEIEAHFATRVRQIVRIPYDPQLASGSVVRWSRLEQATRNAARELAVAVVEGMPA